ncbi:Protein of unknown function [Pyronema omphalodes CBS 100304]|uniref:Uncharacterized protein n=1 Tax=Pyronema omphalodes (strain CBS 100304) TaxID=1076935 RepID=U4KUJ1_PYROM|nr:Protein of unknown function [Pyronema omphalodes CBS 100304]
MLRAFCILQMLKVS